MLYNNEDVIECINKSEFKNLLSLATQESYFIFNNVFYKQKDGVAMGPPLGPTMSKVFLSFYEVKWLEQCPKEFKLVFYKSYLNNIFVLSLNTRYPNMSFSFEKEKNGKLSFLNKKIFREKGKFVTTISWKPTISGVYTHFQSFLPTIDKFGMAYTLAYRCFKIYSD